MKRSAALLLSLLAPALLGGCGFEPVYGPERANAGAIKIPEIAGRTGHFLRQELAREIGPGVPGITGSSELEVKLSEAVNRLGFQPDQAASRSDYIGVAVWTLRKPDGATIATGRASEASSFNFANAAYADISAQTAAENRVASLLAREIRDQLFIEAKRPQIKPTETPTNTIPGPSRTDTIPGTTSTGVSPINPVDAPPFKQ
jgi:LPS-assembly lipoprotein